MITKRMIIMSKMQQSTINYHYFKLLKMKIEVNYKKFKNVSIDKYDIILLNI